MAQRSHIIADECLLQTLYKRAFTRSGAAGDTGVDNHVGGIFPDYSVGAQGGVDFAYAYLGGYYVVPGHGTGVVAATFDFGKALEHGQEELQLLVHSYDDCDFHNSMIDNRLNV